MQNLEILNSFCSGKIYAVVKANAYGLGGRNISKFIEESVDGFCVANVEECAELRECGIKKDILVFGASTADEYRLICRYNGIGTIYSRESFELVKTIDSTSIPRICVAIDTGMHRIGFDRRDIIKFSNLPGKLREKIVGIYSHYGDINDRMRADEQERKFREMSNNIEFSIGKRLFKSISNTNAILHFHDFFDVARIGIGLYGMNDKLLSDAVEIISKIVQIREIPLGEHVGYDDIFLTKSQKIIATVCIGYADGYGTVFSNRGIVRVRGTYVPVVGRVCMDYCMIDVTDVPDVSVGDDVVLFDETILRKYFPGEVSPYEFLCGIGNRVERIYIT